jgi:uncharacterized protein
MLPVESTEKQIPFWTYEDIGLMIGLVVPAMVMAMLSGWALKPFFPNKAIASVALQMVIYLVMLGGLAVMLRLKYHASFWPSMGWRLPWPRMFVTLLAGPLLAIAMAALGFALQAPRGGMLMDDLLQDRLSIFAIGFGATTFGPLCEEILFRGFAQPLLVRDVGPLPGILLCSLPFSLLHGPQYGWSWQHLVLLTTASMVFGWVRWRCDSTAASTLLHSAYNLTFFMALLTQR